MVVRGRAVAAPATNLWGPVSSWSDPTALLWNQFRPAARQPGRDFKPTGLGRKDYLALIESEVDFWKKYQEGSGAIRDPYLGNEYQYSTPSYAWAAAVLVAHAGRDDLLDSAARATDRATETLSRRRAASGHEDFFSPMLAHVLPLLKDRVKPDRYARWVAALRRYDPYRTYRMKPGSNNWNVVSLSGEGHLQRLGLRPRSNGYLADSLGEQGKHFRSPYGVYTEGPMAYDHFPRLWAADLLADGYEGPLREELDEVLRRGALTSLFLQSPWGELPAGGRSAHHQWNEAQQCATYEIYAARAQEAGDKLLASVYKRAAHLSLASMKRWVRPSGEMQIVKNWVDPARRHGYESYSSHSQYNLLPMAMLAIAYEHAAPTEMLPEAPAPADAGGYVLHLEALHKVVANAGGTYVEIDTRADHHYDATGLIRVHIKGVSPQLGPSDSLLASPKYRAPGPHAPRTTGIGISWKAGGGGAGAAEDWRRLGALHSGQEVTGASVKVLAQKPKRVVFEVTYEGRFPGGVKTIVERYVVTPGRVELTTRLPGYNGPTRYHWPVLADDGRAKTEIKVDPALKMVSVRAPGAPTSGAQTFTAPGATHVDVAPGAFPNHNGWARVGEAHFPAGAAGSERGVTLVIAPRPR